MSLALAVTFTATGMDIRPAHAAAASEPTEARTNLGMIENTEMARFTKSVNSGEWFEASQIKECGADTCFENGRKMSSRDPKSGDITEYYNDSLNRVKRIVRSNGEEERFVSYVGDTEKAASKYFYSGGVLRHVSEHSYREVNGKQVQDVKVITDSGMEYKMSYAKNDDGQDVLQSFSVAMVSMPAHLGQHGSSSALAILSNYLRPFSQIDPKSHVYQGSPKLAWDISTNRASLSMGWTMQGSMSSGGLFTMADPATGEKWSIKLGVGGSPDIPFFIEEMNFENSSGTADQKLTGQLTLKMDRMGYLTQSREMYKAPVKPIPNISIYHETVTTRDYVYGTVSDGVNSSAVLKKVMHVRDTTYAYDPLAPVPNNGSRPETGRSTIDYSFDHVMVLGKVYLSRQQSASTTRYVYSKDLGYVYGWDEDRDEINEFIVVGGTVQLARQKTVKNTINPPGTEIVYINGQKTVRTSEARAQHNVDDVVYGYEVLGGKTYVAFTERNSSSYNPYQKPGPYSNPIYQVTWDRRDSDLKLISGKTYQVGGRTRSSQTSFAADGNWYLQSGDGVQEYQLAELGGTVVVMSAKSSSEPSLQYAYWDLPSRIPGYRADMAPDQLMGLLAVQGLLTGEFAGMTFDEVRVRADQAGFDASNFNQAGLVFLYLVQNKGIDMDHALMKQRTLAKEGTGSHEIRYEYQMINGRPYETLSAGRQETETRYYSLGRTSTNIRDFEQHQAYDDKGYRVGTLSADFMVANGENYMRATYSGVDPVTNAAKTVSADLRGANASNLLWVLNSARPEDGLKVESLATFKVVEKTVTVPVAVVPAPTVPAASAPVAPTPAVSTPVTAPPVTTPVPTPVIPALVAAAQDASTAKPAETKQLTYRIEYTRPTAADEFRAVKVTYPEIKMVSIVVGQADIESGEQDDILMAEEQMIDQGYRVTYGSWEAPRNAQGAKTLQYGLLFQKLDQFGKVFETSMADLESGLVILGDIEYTFTVDVHGQIQIGEPAKKGDDFGVVSEERDEQGRVTKAVFVNGRWITTEYLAGSSDPKAKLKEVLYAANGSMLRTLQYNSTGTQVRRIQDEMSGRTLDCFTSECWEESIGAGSQLLNQNISGVKVAMIESDSASEGHIGGVQGVLNKLLLPQSSLSVYQAADHFDVARSIKTAALLGNRVINLSLEFTAAGIASWAMQTGRDVNQAIVDFKEVMGEAIQFAKSLGAVVVAAAGNSGSQSSLMAESGALTAGASDYLGRRIASSNFGSAISFLAPGYQIASYNPLLKKTQLYTGTSLASPMLAGVVASLFSYDLFRNNGSTNLNQDVITDLLKKTSRDMFSSGWDQVSGWGMIDQGAALSSLSMLN